MKLFFKKSWKKIIFFFLGTVIVSGFSYYMGKSTSTKVVDKQKQRGPASYNLKNHIQILVDMSDPKHIARVECELKALLRKTFPDFKDKFRYDTADRQIFVNDCVAKAPVRCHHSSGDLQEIWVFRSEDCNAGFNGGRGTTDMGCHSNQFTGEWHCH